MRSLGEKAVGVYYSGDSEFLLGPVEFELLDRAATSHNPISFCEWCRKKSCTTLTYFMRHLLGTIQPTAGSKRQKFKKDVRVRTANMSHMN